jgi:hypothetical protein
MIIIIWSEKHSGIVGEGRWLALVVLETVSYFEKGRGAFGGTSGFAR